MNKLFTKIVGAALGLTMAIGVGVAVSGKEAKPVEAASSTQTWTASSGAIAGQTSGTIENGDYDWSFTRSSVIYTGWSSNCIQLGSKSGPESLTLTNSNYSGTISSVAVECASYNGAHKIAISVGGTPYLAATATSSWTTVDTKTGTGSSSGTITISFTNGTRALYIKSISVTYETSSGVSVSGMEVLDENADELSDGDEINLNASSSASVSADITCGVSYSDSSSDGNVDISSSPSAGFTFSTEDDETYTLTFTANGDFDVTIAAHQDDNYSITITYHISGIPTYEYELYTGSIVAGDYVIMSGDANFTYVLGNTVSSNRVANGSTTPTVSNDTITNPSSSFVWHIAKDGNYWTIQNADNDKYLAGTSTKNHGALVDSVDDHSRWTISHSTSWVFENLGRASDSDTPANRYLRNNTTSGWACYSSAQSNAPALFKLPSSDPAIEVEVTGESTLGVGETATLEATKINGATGTIGWATSNSSVLSISAATGDSITVTGVSAGSATITASLTGCDDVETPFTVRNGTSASPYSVAEARTAIDGSDSAAKTGVYTSGIISQVDSLNSDDSITYWISDDGETTSDQLEIFKGFGLSSATFSSVDDLQVGDVVTVCGNLTKYSSTYEYASGSSLTSFNRPDVQLVSISSITGSLTANSGDLEWDLSSLTVNGVLSNSASTVNVTRYVELTTEDVPGTVQTTTQRNVSVTATGIDDNTITHTNNVTGTIQVIEGELDTGRYFIFTENGALENRNYTNGTSDKVDITATSAWTFTLVADDTYTISNGSQYLYASNANTGLRTKATGSNWVLTALTGDDAGLYQLVTSDGSNDRYLCDYNDSKNDWRTYKEASIGSMYKLSIVEEKEVFANNFLDTFTAGCNAEGGYTAEDMDWTSASTQFATLSSANQLVFKNATYTKSGSGSGTVITPATGVAQSIAETVARYDYIVGMHGTSTFSDFMDREPASLSGAKVLFATLTGDKTNSVAIIVIISMVSVTAIGGYFFIRKRKEN